MQVDEFSLSEGETTASNVTQQNTMHMVTACLFKSCLKSICNKETLKNTTGQNMLFRMMFTKTFQGSGGNKDPAADDSASDAGQT